jgi:hypothetical protein
MLTMITQFFKRDFFPAKSNENKQDDELKSRDYFREDELHTIEREVKQQEEQLRKIMCFLQ